MSGFRASFREDLKMFRLVHRESGIFKYLYYPDFRMIFIFRLSQLFYRYRLTRPFSYLMTVLNDLICGVWIGPRVEVGPGFFLGHARGLVVNPTAKIGSHCSIMQRVTIGGPNVVIGNYVEMNANATIISNARSPRAALSIGNNVIIGAGAVVISDVPDNSVVVGVPAKVVKQLAPGDNWVDYRHSRSVKGDPIGSAN